MKTLLSGLLTFLFFGSVASAQVPQLINYQGRVAVGGTNFDGTGRFKFALVNGAGSLTFWSNDGTSAAGSEPTAEVALSVARGLYSVLLGDVTAPGMTQVIPSTVFTNADVRLRVWFDDGTSGSQLLSPDQRIVAVGYALMSANVPDGIITSNKIAAGAINASKIADNSISASKIASNVITSVQLADDIDLGVSNVFGRLDVFHTTVGTPAITLFGTDNQISTYGDDGLEQVRLWGASWGQLYLFNSRSNNDIAVNLAANGISGGSLSLNNSNGIRHAFLSGANGGGQLVLDRSGGDIGVDLTTQLNGSRLRTYNSSNQIAVDLRSEFGASGSGSWLGLYHRGQERITFAAQSATFGDGGLVGLKNRTAGDTMILAADTGAGNPEISMRNTNGFETVRIRAAEVTGTGAEIVLRKADGTASIELDADFNGDGRIVTQELQITGGSDLSEQFEIQAGHRAVAPGMVVCIDPDRPGELVISTKAYDRTVAGVISGAGGVKPGMLMGQKGTVADGQHPVALTGRVYCMVDASRGEIRPGDLITTSDTPGHGMKVNDHASAQGAIIGKAMTGLKTGAGLVLVLVSLQ